jgi:lipopolysaccharide/colanic/teichoic acid biosynthesis glycosyltransferase
MSLMLGLAALPVIGVAVVLLQRRSPGPPFFRSMREGRDGRPFAMLKLRTMHQDAEARLDVLLRGSSEAREEWTRYRRITDDPRVVAGVGRALRQWSIDELPQLWHVLLGDMSLIGPRPLELEVAERLPRPAMEVRRQMRPGMTGLWQVSGRSTTDLEALCALDVAYVEGWSLRLDASILLRTPAAVLSRHGAY